METSSLIGDEAEDLNTAAWVMYRTEVHRAGFAADHSSRRAIRFPVEGRPVEQSDRLQHTDTLRR